MLISLCIAIALAVLCFFGMQAMPAETSAVVVDILTNVLFGKIIAIFSALATPLVFFAVIIGITGVGDIEQFGKMGKTVLGRMGVTYAIAAVVLLVGCTAVFGTQPTISGSGGSAVEQVIQLVLDMIPSNLVVPFSGDNDLQVIVLAIFIGIVMLMLGDKVEGINSLFQEASTLVNKMMMVVCELIPLIVFLGVLKLLCGSEISQILGMINMIVVFLLGSAVVIGILIARTMVTMKVPFSTIFKKQLPTLLINLTTGSQVSALPENMKCCKEKFGIDSKLCDFAIPFGIVTYMPNGAIFLGVTVWGLASINGVPVDALMAVTVMIVSVVIAIATPPIPGNGYIALPILLTSCGLPADYMPLGVVFATIVAYLLPAFNGCSIQLELLMAANRLGLVDREKLEKAASED